MQCLNDMRQQNKSVLLLCSNEVSALLVTLRRIITIPSAIVLWYIEVYFSSGKENLCTNEILKKIDIEQEREAPDSTKSRGEPCAVRNRKLNKKMLVTAQDKCETKEK